jgi:acyl-CoA thioester hydrolase
MYEWDVNIRVRYGETDKMGYLYYGNYAMYYEVARVETIRSLGVSYKEMEDNGIMLPVLELKSKFIKPAYYDELLTVKTTIPKLPDIRIEFKYQIYNEQNTLINTGSTELVFFDWTKKRPCRIPEEILTRLSDFFN